MVAAKLPSRLISKVAKAEDGQGFEVLKKEIMRIARVREAYQGNGAFAKKGKNAENAEDYLNRIKVTYGEAYDAILDKNCGVIRTLFSLIPKNVIATMQIATRNLSVEDLAAAIDDYQRIAKTEGVLHEPSTVIALMYPVKEDTPPQVANVATNIEGGDDTGHAERKTKEDGEKHYSCSERK